MDPYLLFKEKLGDQLSRKLLSSPHTYRLAKIFFLKRDFPFEANRMMAAMALEQAAEAYRKKQPVAWTSAFFPGELIHALGLIPFAPEVAAAVTASLGLSPGLLRLADQLGLSSESCSFHRCAAAGTAYEYFPLPDLLLASSHLCDGAPQLFRYLARRYDKPFYLLDVPASPGPAAERHLARQLEELTAALESLTGRRLTTERIEQTFNYANRARAAQLRVHRLRQRLPSPLRGEVALGYIYLAFLGQGHPETAAIYETLCRELEQMIAAGNQPAAESFRLIWLHLKPYYDNKLLSYLENELQAIIVHEEMNDIYWAPLDPERPFLSLARKILSHPGLGAAQRRFSNLLRIVKEYRADGVIHYSHWGCRQAVGSSLYLKERLRREGIPFLLLDGDCIDPNSFPIGQARTRVESFIELLSERSG